MMAFMFLLIPTVLVCTLLALLIHHFASASDMPPSQRKRMPSCGNCGYPAKGISTLNCPECGADLREVGIVTGMRRLRTKDSDGGR